MIFKKAILLLLFCIAPQLSYGHKSKEHFPNGLFCKGGLLFMDNGQPVRNENNTIVNFGTKSVCLSVIKYPFFCKSGLLFQANGQPVRNENNTIVNFGTNEVCLSAIPG